MSEFNIFIFIFFFQAEDGIRDGTVTGVQTCALPIFLAWAESIPGLRTILREPIYFWHLWRGLKDLDVAHIFSAGYWSFLLAPAPAWLIAKARGAKSLINYHSGEARDHLRRFRSAK